MNNLSRLGKAFSFSMYRKKFGKRPAETPEESSPIRPEAGALLPELKENQKYLYKEGDESRQPVVFTIVEEHLSRGANFTSATAWYEGSGKGILKNFRPAYMEGIPREQAVEEYLAPYRMLQEIARKASDSDMETFIPHFELYREMNRQGEETGEIFIWDQSQVLTFEEMCEQIREEGNHHAERNLVRILNTIQSLCVCMGILHEKGLIHRDIKPANFGFQVRKGEVLTENLSLFDLDSIHSVEERNILPMETIGYSEPESRYSRPTVQSDLYSIGASLYYALIGMYQEEGNQTFRSEDWENLPQLLDASPLLQAISTRANPRMQGYLTTVLQKSLAPRAQRYENAEDMAADLGHVLQYALPVQLSSGNTAGVWKLEEWENSLDEEALDTAVKHMMCALFDHPLYQNADMTKDQIRVCVLGFGTLGQRFTDLALQVLQMPGKNPDILAVNRDVVDLDFYLQKRPAMKDFFEVQSEPCKAEQPLGRISLKQAEIAQDHPLESLEQIVSDLEEPGFDAFFISLQDGKLNQAAAKAARELYPDARIFWVDYTSQMEEENGTIRLDISRFLEQNETLSHLERMAFNAHLVWQKDLFRDMKEVWKEFRSPYNYYSNMANVLSLKYKLRGLDIDTDEEWSAPDIAEILRSMENEPFGTTGWSVKDELLWREHRRWLAEKICSGYTALTDYSYCMEGRTRDDARKKHICLVESRPGRGLQKPYFTQSDTKEKNWKKPDAREVQQLDDLDRVSLNYHKELAHKAAGAREGDLLHSSFLKAIEDSASRNRECMIAFRDWKHCIEEILNGHSEKGKVYEGLKERLLQASGNLPAEAGANLRQEVRLFNREFWPLIGASQFRDFKLEDENLVMQADFILTYSWKNALIIPYNDGGADRSNTDLFGNVAALSMVAPKTAIYVFQARSEAGFQAVEETMPMISRWLNQKNMSTAVSFLILTEDSLRQRAQTFEKQAKAVFRDRLESCHVFTGRKKADQILDQIQLWLDEKEYDKIYLESNSAPVSCYLSEILDILPSYRFDSLNLVFEDIQEAEELNWIRKKPYLSAADLAVLQDSEQISISQPEVGPEFDQLWEAYDRNPGEWKVFCQSLNDSIYDRDFYAPSVMALFRRSANSKGPVRSYTYLIPSCCEESVQVILDALRQDPKLPLIDAKSRIVPWTASSSQVQIYSREDIQKGLDRVFANPGLLMNRDYIRTDFIPQDNRLTVKISYDGLPASHVLLKKTSDEKYLNLLKNLGYIRNLKIDDRKNEASFTFATREIKDLCCTAGRILEIYVYRQLQESGKFDDVVSSCEIRWGNTNVENEFDCVATKGFQTVLIECKARKELSQEMIQKLDYNARKFCVNPVPVLAADMRQSARSCRGQNTKNQIDRAALSGITVLNDPQDIYHIDEKICELLEEKRSRS